MEELNVNTKPKNWKLITAILAYPAIFLIVHLISVGFFEINIFHYVTWIFWPTWLFALYRYQKSIPKGESQESSEFRRLNLYCVVGVIAIFGRALTIPFSNFEQLIYISFQACPFVFPLIMLLGIPSKSGLRKIAISVNAIFLVLGILGFGALNLFTRGELDFKGRDVNYYSKVVAACNDLISIAKTNQIPNTWVSSQSLYPHWVIPSDDPGIGPILRQIHATEIKVIPNPNGTDMNVTGTYGVVINRGDRDGFGISWRQHDFGNGNLQWELSANGGDGGSEIVFSLPKK